MKSFPAYVPPGHVPYLEKCPALALIGGTPLVRVDLPELKKPGVEVYAKVEYFNPGGSIKDRPVLWMLLGAIEDGLLTPEKTVLDSSSGNAGIAYAMIGKALGRRVKLVIPENASEERKKRIRAHGAELHFTDPVEGYDEALREVHRQAEAEPAKYFFSDQYSNANNWRSHFYTTAHEILEQTGRRVTHFVGGVGTGGTTTGVGRRLKEELPGVEVTCIVPEAFPGIEGLKPLDDPGDIVPEIFDASVVDVKVKVSIEEAYDACQKLARIGFFVGQSSGAYIKGAESVVQRIDRGVVVTVLNDLGERYFSTGLWGRDVRMRAES
ncbi:MAG TPA: PLP-dependent cysteine synthase family protein [Planctomycetota bacterium]|nr:PLP-dependent cysteine synthase family protein [Planctomycetota bacterium]